MFHITTDAIDPESLRRAVEHDGCGAVVVFHGTVRSQTGERIVRHLEYEAYDSMAVKAMRTIAAELRSTLDVKAIACTHRVGRVEIGEDAMVLAVSSPHRKAALEAVGTFIARLKREVPIWKKEHFEGGEVWVGTPDDPQGVGA